MKDKFNDTLDIDDIGFDDEYDADPEEEFETDSEDEMGIEEYEQYTDEYVEEYTEQADEQVDEQTAASNNKKSKKKRSLLSKKSNEPEEPEVIPDKKLVLLMDKYIPEFITYCRNAGLNVHSIFYKVEDAENFLLFNEEIRLVVFETGIGKFNSIALREYVANLIGMCEDDKDVSVFYTDSVIKSDVKQQNREAHNRVKWHKYITTITSIAELLQYKENFILDGSEMQDTSEEDIQHLKGQEVDLSDHKASKVVRMITPDTIRNNILEVYGVDESKYKSIEAFEPRY